MDFAYIQKNANDILDSIEKRVSTLGIQTPELVVVTKSATLDEIHFLLSQFQFSSVAENRTDLFLERQNAISSWGFTPKYHLIGSLQTNKVKQIIGKTDLIQSLDRESLASEIEKQAIKNGIAQVNCLLEINSAREEAKGGVLPENVFRFYETLLKYPHIRLCGMMTMGASGNSDHSIRKYFEETKNTFDQFQSQNLFSVENPILSMGMSGSYLEAIESGANMIRIGRGFFKK